jgi:hypothetical protein
MNADPRAEGREPWNYSGFQQETHGHTSKAETVTRQSALLRTSMVSELS